MKLNNDFINEYVRGIFKPGAVLVSYGMRGGGKTHCAVSFCQRLIEGFYEGTPKHVVLITNVIFVKKTESGFATESPPGVHTIHSMKEIFPIVVDTLERYGRRDTMIVLLLDEAQNFLLGDMNNVGDMAASMKKFCGIIRKFNLCLWLLSPAMRVPPSATSSMRRTTPETSIAHSRRTTPPPRGSSINATTIWIPVRSCSSRRDSTSLRNCCPFLRHHGRATRTR